MLAALSVVIFISILISPRFIVRWPGSASVTGYTRTGRTRQDVYACNKKIRLLVWDGFLFFFYYYFLNRKFRIGMRGNGSWVFYAANMSLFGKIWPRKRRVRDETFAVSRRFYWGCRGEVTARNSRPNLTTLDSAGVCRFRFLFFSLIDGHSVKLIGLYFFFILS